MSSQAKAWGGQRSKRLNQLVLSTYGDQCHLCGKPGADSADHLQPRSKGGSDDLDNLRPAHRRCNSRRGAKSLAQYRQRYAANQLHPEQPANDWEFFK